MKDRAATPQAWTWDPAGPDTALVKACQDLRLGRWHAARDLLAATGDDGDLRCNRTQIMAACDRGGVARWLAGAGPSNPDALAMAARVAVVETVRAALDGSVRDLATRAAAAAEMCVRAADVDHADPVPVVALLQLAEVVPDLGGRAPHQFGGIEGPWHLLAEVNHRHAGNREAHMRFVTSVAKHASIGHAFTVAHLLAGAAPAGSPLHLLPLTVHAIDFRRAVAADRSFRAVTIRTDHQWSRPHAEMSIIAAYRSWFADRGRAAPVLMDLHLLAHAAFMSGQYSPSRKEMLLLAAHVFEQIGPYGCAYPWSLTGDAAKELERARRAGLDAAGAERRATGVAAARPHFDPPGPLGTGTTT